MPKWLSKENAEWALGLWHRFRGRALTRLAGYLVAAAVALETDILQVVAQAGLSLIGIQATFQDTPHFVVMGFVAAAVVLLIADAQIPIQVPPPNTHDVQLYKRFRELFDDDVLRFFRTHDLSNSFHHRYFNVLDAANAEWVGPRNQFEDKAMAEICVALVAANRRLLRMIAKYTNPSERNSEWLEPEWIGEDWFTESTLKKAKEMNDAGTELVAQIDKLDALARNKGIMIPNHS